MSSLADQFVRVRRLCGVEGIPTCRRNAGQWLRRRGIPTVTIPSNGGPAEVVDPADLPHEVQAELMRRNAEAAQVPAGEDCAETMAGYWAASPALRAEADRKAEIALLLLRGRLARQGVRDRYKAVREAFGTEGTRDAALREIERRTKDVAPVTFPGCSCAIRRAGRRAPTCPRPPGRSS